MMVLTKKEKMPNVRMFKGRVIMPKRGFKKNVIIDSTKPLNRNICIPPEIRMPVKTCVRKKSANALMATFRKTDFIHIKC